MPRLFLGGSLFWQSCVSLLRARRRRRLLQSKNHRRIRSSAWPRLASCGRREVLPSLPRLSGHRLGWSPVKTIPRVKAARTPAEYRIALDGMLDVLGDPATRVEMMAAEPPPVRAAPAPPADSTYFHVVDGFVVVTPPA